MCARLCLGDRRSRRLALGAGGVPEVVLGLEVHPDLGVVPCSGYSSLAIPPSRAAAGTSISVSYAIRSGHGAPRPR